MIGTHKSSSMHFCLRVELESVGGWSMSYDTLSPSQVLTEELLCQKRILTQLRLKIMRVYSMARVHDQKHCVVTNLGEIDYCTSSCLMVGCNDCYELSKSCVFSSELQKMCFFPSDEFEVS